MGDCVRLVHLLVSREKSAATAEVTNKKLAKDHGVPDHLVKAEKPIEFLAAGLVVAKNRIQTEVSARTITQPCGLPRPSTSALHAAEGHPRREARCPAAPAGAVGRVADHGLQPKADRVGIRDRARCDFRLSEKSLIDIPASSSSISDCHTNMDVATVLSDRAMMVPVSSWSSPALDSRKRLPITRTTFTYTFKLIPIS